LGFGVEDLGCGVVGLRFGVWSSGFAVWGFRFSVRDLGVWGLELGCRVSDLKLRVQSTEWERSTTVVYTVVWRSQLPWFDVQGGNTAL